ncbi:protein kinase [Persicitalea sp.]|uniref:protein kinase domain-containing protein n=1 Tax=Persicitalea sp. TaxID=3100273 RepID=UPI003592EBEB
MNPSFTTYSDFRQRYPIQFGDDSLWLGSGTYGRVIKVEDQVETEWVAIKICECRSDDTKSLKAEVELARKVPRHANIARYDACHRLQTEMGMSDFAIMKYYPDGNLANLLKSRSLSEVELRELVRGILEGLEALHRQRIVHRDFKPANILISRDNRGRLVPKIADFGLSKFVAEDEIDSSDFDLSDGRGTPAYKAPEQITGGTVSFNLDLWAFGVILYEMVTGEKPFSSGAQSNEPTQRREMENKIAAVQLPDRLTTVAEPFQGMIRRCLVKDIKGRVRKPDELLSLLEKPTTQIPVSKPVPLAVPIGGPREEYTDVFIPSGPIVPTPKQSDRKINKPSVVLPIEIPSVRVWLPLAIGAAVMVVSMSLWFGRTTASSYEKGIGQSVAAIDTKNLENGDKEIPTPPASVQKAGIIDGSGPASSKPTKSELSTIKKGGENLNKPTESKADKVALKKQEAQQEYEDLIEKGNGAINSSNDKAAAMNYFRSANQLATVNGLDTAKGNAAYTQYLEKGDRINDRDSYLGAMAWYKVAQSLRPTDEVKRKIRECEINLNL